MMKEQAAEAGFNLQLVSQEFGTWVADLLGHNYELHVGGGLPYGNEHLPLQFNHTNNWTRKEAPLHLPEPETDALLDKILVTMDINERQELALQVTRRIIERHGPLLCLRPL
jgi:ABC-type transport system substrate-binding protein